MNRSIRVRNISFAFWIALFWSYTTLPVLKNYPLMRPLNEAGIVFSSIGLIALLVTVLFGSRRLSNFSFYILILTVCVPIHLAGAAYLVWGQPFMFGFLARRTDLLAGSVVILVELSRRNRLNIRTVIRGIIWLGWVTTAIFALTALFLSPEDFLGFQGFAAGGTFNAAEFIFHTELSVFLTFYYWVSARRTKSVSHRVISLALMALLLWLGVGRSGLVSILIGILALEYLLGRLSGFVVFLSVSLLAIGVIVLSSSILAPGVIQSLIEPLKNALDVVLGGTESGDVSADARLYEAAQAWSIINQHWMFGSGFLSSQWNNGFLGQFDYLYPADIGLVGVLLVYGLFGMSFFLAMPYFAWKYGRCLLCRRGQLSIPYIAAVGWLIYALARTVPTGFSIFSPAATLFFIYLIIEIRRVTISSPKSGIQANE